MLRESLAVITVTACAFVISPDTAVADPTADDTQSSAHCEFSVSPPQAAVIPGGGQAVMATLTPGACTGAFMPNTLTVCVAQSGGQSNCSSAFLYKTVQVVLGTSPHGEFTATGKLCGIVLEAPQPTCTARGPIRVTL